ncbi:hypothetical protein EFA69_12780 [Rufibacter immobilis]|uniref:Lysine-specific metallo-endopeptidase domain-containing protein n=1 Tax=Rufibacter immobilis TaxID=1348778 RepID=A0A3M9MUN7_9BACT|nr:hypothetical protein [Rufibacter immobilis]RNI28915.1 hypothetical protein EFA69_12780 [Rufibacter immobilis]
MSIQLTYSGNLGWIRESTTIANGILSSEEFFNMIADTPGTYDDIKPADLSPADIAGFFRNSSLRLDVREYTDDDPDVGGEFRWKTPNSLWANIGNGRRGCTYAAVLIHECVHALSYHTPGADFTHPYSSGDENYDGSNSDTAPYTIQRQTRESFCREDFTLKEDLIEVKVDESE